VSITMAPTSGLFLAAAFLHTEDFQAAYGLSYTNEGRRSSTRELLSLLFLLVALCSLLAFYFLRFIVIASTNTARSR
jgi:hypothetical protein